jgi:hypothetical protein
MIRRKKRSRRKSDDAICNLRRLGMAEDIDDEDFDDEDLLVFDKAKWHYEGEFPGYLDEERAFVHTGMFLGWIIDNKLYSEDFADDFRDEIRSFKSRKMTGSDVYSAADGVFAEEMVNPEGRAFAVAYFDFDKGQYLKDYEKLLSAKLPSMYHVKDTWENYDRLKLQIDKRFAAWRRKK